MKFDTFFSSSEAVQYGLADRVIENRDSLWTTN
jgi:ATP-dependent protease ClpP protease subunit